jgi:hypothetical protein
MAARVDGGSGFGTGIATCPSRHQDVGLPTGTNAMMVSTFRYDISRHNPKQNKRHSRDTGDNIMTTTTTTTTTYAEQVKEILAIGGDPSFLVPVTKESNTIEWDGTIDESAHFGGWEKEKGEEVTASPALRPATPTSTTRRAVSAPEMSLYFYAELEHQVKAVAGDPSSLTPAGVAPSSAWDGTIDESAHFGGWEN